MSLEGTFGGGNGSNNSGENNSKVIFNSRGEIEKVVKDLQQVDNSFLQIFETADKMESKMTDITNKIGNLSNSTMQYASQLADTVRKSEDVLTKSVSDNAISNINQIVTRVQEVRGVVDTINQAIEDIKDHTKMDEAGRNMMVMTDSLAKFASMLSDVDSAHTKLWVSMSKTEISEVVANQLEKISKSYGEVIKSVSNAASSIPAEIRESFEPLTDLSGTLLTINNIAREATGSLGNLFEVTNQAGEPQQLKAVEKSLGQLTDLAKVSAVEINKLFSELSNNSTNSGAISTLYDDLLKSRANINMKSVDSNMESDGYEATISNIKDFFEKFKHLQDELSASMNNVNSSFDVVKLAEISNQTVEMARQAEKSFKIAQEFAKENNVTLPPEMNAGMFRNSTDILGSNLMSMANADVNKDNSLKDYILGEFSHLDRKVSRGSKNAGELEQHANLLSLGQLDGKNVNFDPFEVAKEARNLMENNQRVSVIRDQYATAMDRDDVDMKQMHKLFPGMAEAQSAANENASLLARMINMAPEDIKKLPDDVRDVINKIYNVVRDTRLSNDNIINIGVSLNREELKEDISMLRNFRQELTDAEKQLNGTSKSVFDNLNSVTSALGKGASIFNKGTSLLGMGALLSGAGLVKGTISASQSQGQLETQMALAEYASGATGHNNDRFNSLYESGLDLNRMTNGVLGIEDLTKNFNSYTRNVQGQYGKNNDMDAMQDFATTSTLLQGAFNVSDSSVQSNVDFFYKELKGNASEVNSELLKLTQTSEQLNIPFGKYLDQVTELAKQFRNIGIDGKAASNIIATLIQGGMSNDMAMQYASSMGKTLTSMDPGVLAYGGVTSGAYGNFYDAVGEMKYGMYNADGSVNDQVLKKQVQTMVGMINQGTQLSNGEGQQMIMGQYLTGVLGMSDKDASITMSKMKNGTDMEDVLKAFYDGGEGYGKGEGTKTAEDLVVSSQEKLAAQIASASENLSGTDKTLNAYLNQQANIAHALEDSLRAATDFSKAIYALPMDELKDSLLDNKVAIYALIAAMALSGTGVLAAGAKGVTSLASKAKNKIFGGAARGAAGAADDVAAGAARAAARSGAAGAEAAAARGLLGKIPKVKGGGLLGLGLLAGGIGLEYAFGDHGENTVPTQSSGSNYLMNMTGTSGTSLTSGGANSYSDLDQYAINTKNLGGGAGRFGKGALEWGITAAGLPFGLLGAGATMGINYLGESSGIYDSMFGTSDEKIRKQYGGEGLLDKASDYRSYIYQKTSGSTTVDENFSLVAAKAIEDYKNSLLSDKTQDQKYAFGTEYAKSIAAGSSNSEALEAANKTISSSLRLEGLSKEQLSNSIDSLVAQQAMGTNLADILENEMPKNATETQKGLEKIADTTGVKIDELIAVIKESGLTEAVVVANAKKDGTMAKIEENEKANKVDDKIKTMIDSQLGYYKDADKNKATAAYLANKDFLSVSGFSDSETQMWLKTMVTQDKAGKSNDEASKTANDYIARYRSGVETLEKSSLAEDVKAWFKTDEAKYARPDLNNQSFENQQALATAMGVPWETMNTFLKDTQLTVGELQQYLNTQDDNTKLDIYDPTSPNKYSILSKTFEDNSDKTKTELENLNKKQEEANKLLNQIAINGSTSSSSSSGIRSTDSANNVDALRSEQLSMRNAKSDSSNSVDELRAEQNAARNTVASMASGSGNTTDVRGTSGLTAAQLNKQLGGALAGHGQDFLDAEKVSGVSAAILAAISMHETGNGTSKAVNDSRHNVGGMMKASGGQMSFDSVSDSIDYFGAYIKRKYIDDGLTSVADIQKRYAPVGAGNDPNSLNQHWVGGVSKYWSGLTGKTAPAIPTSTIPALDSSYITGGDYDASSTDYSSSAFGPIDVGFGSNDPFSGIGDTYSKSKYVSNLYGRGYNTLANGTWNTQSFSAGVGEAAKSVEHTFKVDVDVSKLGKDPEFQKELEKAISDVFSKHGNSLKEEYAEQIQQVVNSMFN
ncbi:hypothetical protein D3C81_415030 [compost metagenome]